MTGKREGDFEIIDVYDVKQEEFERFRDEHDDFEWWQEGEIAYTAEEYREKLFGELQPGQVFTAFKYLGSGENVTIPDGVTQLSSGLFEGNDRIKRISVPDDVEEISDSVFKDCTALEEVKFGKGVTEISALAFSGCTSLKEIELPSVGAIRNGTFRGCTALTQVTIPDSVRRLGEEAFADCTALSCVHLGSGLKWVQTRAFKGCTALKSITLPPSLQTVDLHAFAQSGIEELYLPKNVDDVGSAPFLRCRNLKKVEVDPDNTRLICKDNCIVRGGMLVAAIGDFKLPNDGSIKKIWHWMFNGNRDLTEIDIPEGVTHLFHSVFECCSNLRRVGLPSTLEVVGESDFAGCDALEEIVIPGSVETVEREAFYCSGIKRLVIKRGVKILGNNAFNGCTNLVEAYIPSSVYKIDCGFFNGDLFRDCNKNLRVYMEKHENGAHTYLARFLGTAKVVFIDKDPIFD